MKVFGADRLKEKCFLIDFCVPAEIGSDGTFQAFL